MLTNRNLLIPYIAQYFAYIVIASSIGNHVSTEVDYVLRIILCSGLLFWAWKWYSSLLGPRSPIVSCLTGIFAGILGAFLWIVLLIPFVGSADEAGVWTQREFLLRFVAAAFLVPVIEEVVMRRYIFHLAFEWGERRSRGEQYPLQGALDESSIHNVQPGAWSWGAVIISTLVFASGHQMFEWPASIVYGLLMTLLYILRKDLLTCIVAHGTTNAVLALYVYHTGSWHLW